MRLGIEHGRHRKAERNRGDKDQQNPVGRVICRQDYRTYLDNEPWNDCVSQRDAIDLPLFQLTEERTHLGPRRLRSMSYSSHSVEAGIGHAKRFVLEHASRITILLA